MANHPSAVKRVRQTRRRTVRNRSNNNRLRTAIKRFRTAIREGNAQLAQELFRPTISAIDKAIQKGALHHNAAARYKSNLSTAFNQVSQQRTGTTRSA